MLCVAVPRQVTERMYETFDSVPTTRANKESTRKFKKKFFK